MGIKKVWNVFCKIPTEKFIKHLEFTITNWIFYFNKKFYKQLQGAAMGSPVSPVIFKYLHGTLWILSHSYISNMKWCFGYVDDVHSVTRKDQFNQLQEHLNSINWHIKLTIELPATDGLPFLDTLTKPILTPLNQPSTENPPTQIGT